MPATATRDPLRTGAKVVATTDLRDVPEGTTGKVALVNGLTWVRYWVRWDNGVSLGSINRSALATPAEWKRHLNGEDDEVAAAGGGGGDAEAGGGEDGGGGGVTTPSGTLVPQKLIDRSAAARARLGA